MEIVSKEAIGIKVITTGYDRESETVTLVTDVGILSMSKASAERLRNHLVEFLGPAGKDDLLQFALEVGGSYYSPETGAIDMGTKDKQ